jgi:hypothetical protein
VSRHPQVAVSGAPEPTPRLRNVWMGVLHALDPDSPTAAQSPNLKEAKAGKYHSADVLERALFEQGRRGATFSQFRAAADRVHAHIIGIGLAFHPEHGITETGLRDALRADREAEGACSVFEVGALADLDSLSALDQLIALREREREATDNVIAALKARRATVHGGYLRRAY